MYREKLTSSTGNDLEESVFILGRRQVAEGGTVCRYGGYTLNKQSRTADKRHSTILGVGRGAEIPHRKNSRRYESFDKDSDLD